MRSVQITLALMPILAFSLHSSQVQSDQPPGATSSEVTLTLATSSGESTFHIGQVIPLTLRFTSTKPKAYQIDLRSYDRSGRLNMDGIAINPSSGWDDPLALYFGSHAGYFGGGLGAVGELSAQPTVVQFYLNETVRFSKPGEYRVQVTSPRVSRLGVLPRNSGISVKSNEIQLTIIPATKAWQSQALARALAVLNGPKPASNETSQKRGEAMKVLRYLGTPDAARELALRLNETNLGSDCLLGIAGSPARDAALAEMKSLLKDPDFPISNMFLHAMSIAALPASKVGDPAQREALEAGFREDLVAALSSKRNAALGVSTNTIVEEAAVRSRELSPALKRSTTTQLIASFDDLPVETQAELLQYRWRALDHAAMVPLLRRVAQRYKDFPELRTTEAYAFNSTSGAALQHWYEMEPEAARSTIVEEILRPKPRFGASVLGILADKELPEVDQALAEHLRDSEGLDASGNLASLIHRFASRSIESQVIGYLDERIGRYACAIQEPLLAYLLKQDPSAARSRLETAIAARGTGFSMCHVYLLPEVGKLQNDPLLQELAISALDDSESRVVAGAADYLIKYATATAEETLWAHLTAWSRRWKGREDAMQYVPGQNAQGIEAASAGSNMIQALAAGQGWLTDETRLRRLLELSVGELQRQQVEQYLVSWKAQPWVIQCMPFDPPQFQIAQYQPASLEAAKEKLRQFPRGSRFHLSGCEDPGQKAFREFSAFAPQIGMEIAQHQE